MDKYEYYQHTNQPKVLLINGFSFIPVNNPEKIAKNLNAIQNMDVRNGDIFICTYPKCGTTWTQNIVYMLLK